MNFFTAPFVIPLTLIIGRFEFMYKGILTMKRYGKSYKQWLKEVEENIVKQGFSPEYANAIAMCIRSQYGDKYHYTKSKVAAKRGLYF